MAVSRRLLVTVVALLLAALIGSLLWGREGRASTEEQIAQTAQTKDWNVPVLSALAKALQSGDYERVRALFTKDGVLTTAGDAHSMVYRNTKPQSGQRVDGAVFRHRIGVHLGKRMKVLGTPVRVRSPFAAGYETIAYGYEFPSIPDVGTGLLHLRNGKIVVAVLDPAIRIPFGGG